MLTACPSVCVCVCVRACVRCMMKVRKECPLEALEQVEGLASSVVKVLPESTFFSRTLEAIRLQYFCHK